MEELGYKPGDDWSEDIKLSCVLEPMASMPPVGTH